MSAWPCCGTKQSDLYNRTATRTRPKKINDIKKTDLYSQIGSYCKGNFFIQISLQCLNSVRRCRNKKLALSSFRVFQEVF